MSLQLGIGLIAGICVLWIAYRISRGERREILPPLDPACVRRGTECVPDVE